MDGLFIRLEVAQARLFGQIPVYKADYGVNFLTGQSVAASGQSAPHVERPFREGGRCRGRLYRRGTFKPAWRPAAWKARSSEGMKPFFSARRGPLCGSRGLQSGRR